MNYLRIFPLMLVLFISSCSCMPEKDEMKSDTIRLDNELFRIGVLHIELPENHPSSFAIKSPSETWYVVQDSEDNIQILPQSDFDSKKVFEFKIQEMRGVTWRNSIKSTEKIFTEAGHYLIYFSNNLETEPENTFSLHASVYFSK